MQQHHHHTFWIILFKIPSAHHKIKTWNCLDSVGAQDTYILFRSWASTRALRGPISLISLSLDRSAEENLTFLNVLFSLVIQLNILCVKKTLSLFPSFSTNFRALDHLTKNGYSYKKSISQQRTLAIFSMSILAPSERVEGENFHNIQASL